MDFVKQLFYLKSTDITIDIRLGFDKETLILEGCDTGPKVEQLHGDFDYEDQLTIKERELDKLYRLNGIEPGQKPGLLDALSNEVKFDAFLY